MPSTQSEQTPAEDYVPGVDTTADNATLDAVSDLLGLVQEGHPEVENLVKPEKVEPTTEKSVSELLAETAEKPSDSGETQKTVKPPKTLAELSEMTGIKVEDLYAIEIPASEDGGESQTFGKLKDLSANESDFAGRELQFEERRVKLENDQVKARQDLETILQALPPEAIKPEILQRARAEREVYLDREAARVLDVIPDWGNDETKRKDLTAIALHMSEYGFDQNHVDQIADHRMIRYMRDNMNRKVLVENAMADVKPVKKVPKGTHAKPVGAKTTPTATPESTQTDQLAAIDALLTPKG